VRASLAGSATGAEAGSATGAETVDYWAAGDSAALRMRFPAKFARPLAAGAVPAVRTLRSAVSFAAVCAHGRQD